LKNLSNTINVRNTVPSLALPLTLAACLPLLLACTPKASPPPIRPNQTARPPVAQRPNPNTPIDTIRWTTPSDSKPPIGATGNQPGRPTGHSGDTYHLAFLLPFLTNQASAGAVPEKSRLALQFYTGAKIALQQISASEGINLVADVYDTQINDADFLQLMSNPRLAKADIFIGPVRNSHVEAFARWTQQNRKILVSPETPNSALTHQNPDFIQTNPSLRAHCEAITNYVRRTHRPDAVTLVCKEKEADRLPYFQEANSAAGGAPFTELIVPDATANFDKTDLKKYFKPGRTAVFILPTWASQDFVMAFLRKLRDTKGSTKVEVYGMPQWKSYESIEPEYLSALNVHISSASYIDYSAQEVRDFQQKFYEETGTIPDDDAFNGYDVTLFTGKMLRRYGLSFPERIGQENFTGLRSNFRFNSIFLSDNLDDGRNQPDYRENISVHILKFEQFGFIPVK
jgi:hypothetical protein